MSEVSETCALASHIHDSFFGDNDLLSPDEIKASQVVAQIGSTSSKTSQRIQAYGEIGGQEAFQTLAKDKDGMYYLSTTSTRDGGGHFQFDVRPDSSLEAVEILANTFFMHKLVAIAHARE